MKLFMKYSMISQLITISILITLFIITGCTKKDSDVIKIGAILPLTGEGAKYGEAAKRAINLALKELNNNEGALTRNIEVIFEDSEGVPRKGLSSLEKLIRVDHVPAVIGPLFSSVTLALAPVAEQNEVVILSPTSSSPSISGAGDFIFRNVASDVFEGSIMGNYAYEKLGMRKIAILYINNDYGVGIKNVFKSTFTEIGGQVLSEEAFEQNNTDFRTQLSKIKSSNQDGIYIVGYKELGQLLKQSKELGINSAYLSTVMFEDPEIIEIAGGAAEGVIYSSRAYSPDSEEIVIKEFVQKFNAEFGEQPDIFAALSYDAMKIIALAIKRGGANSKRIRDALYEIKDYPGVVGNTSFDKNGDVIQPAVIKTVVDGKFTEVNLSIEN